MTITIKLTQEQYDLVLEVLNRTGLGSARNLIAEMEAARTLDEKALDTREVEVYAYQPGAEGISVLATVDGVYDWEIEGIGGPAPVLRLKDAKDEDRGLFMNWNHVLIKGVPQQEQTDEPGA